VVIRSGQKEKLAEDTLRRANEELAGYARRRFPSRFENTAQPVLLKIVEEIRTRAAAHGFEREDHVATFLDLTVMYGSDFPESLWAQPILTNESLDPAHKISALTNQVEQSGVKF
jgi:hypothetical protein